MHNRIAIFRKEPNGFTKINVPSSLQRIDSSILVEQFYSANNLLYFWHFDDSVLYVFCLKNGLFKCVSIDFDLPENLGMYWEDRINSVHRDKEGNLLFKINIIYEDYLSWWESEVQRIEGLGDPPMLGSGFPPGSSLFYFLSIDELLDALFPS